MSSAICESYLETQVNTATPQRLRLMLIERALRKAKSAQEAWQRGDVKHATETITQSRDIVTELIAGIQPDQSPLAKQVLGIYLFLLSTLAEAQFSRDHTRLTDIIRVLEEERQTWQAVCETMPDRPTTMHSSSNEELAPQRVDGAWSLNYRGASAPDRPTSAFSIEA